MKKIISLFLALITLFYTAIPAFAIDLKEYKNNMLLNDAIMRLSEDLGSPVNIIGQSVSEIGDLTLCSILVETQDSTKAQSATQYKTGWAFDYWYADKDLTKRLGDVKAFGDFEYDGKTATIVDYSHEDTLKDGASYFVSEQTAKDSSLLSGAYYQIKYKITYNGSTKTRTLKVTCTKDGKLPKTGIFSIFNFIMAKYNLCIDL